MIRQRPWTKQEENTFQRCVDIVGSQWQAISTVIGTRTEMEVRMHAQLDQRRKRKRDEISKQQDSELVVVAALLSLGDPSTSKQTKLSIIPEHIPGQGCEYEDGNYLPPGNFSPTSHMEAAHILWESDDIDKSSHDDLRSSMQDFQLSSKDVSWLYDVLKN
mmetsp:Transcript_44851/g.77627  ORF Transcript_44851/g.77627 Transcript_44851/m.77627 type:complete len:161 (-) Transcript_44851:234-716(-)|eukprot:CAMPEP_0204329078 /NCGR_PEP_ID=MMETSP0469-20131031/13882_1 /ASSEMBLY_ACC=CAM_ASM_000384 /TAXON_ID=2969 /ORGANISM="Oxyrrhis marina" /LENGTH=160 /DNA_ID=CAMNT_0051311613 /DNA_START=118 /DNA_END=600 /DNA_ORIENTATION=-